MWLARDKSGELSLFELKPQRTNNIWLSGPGQIGYMWHIVDKDLNNSLFPDLMWQDVPIEVEIVRKRK